MRVAVVVLGVEPNLLHQILDRALALTLALVDAMDDEWLADDRPDGLARVQRRVRVLEDHLELAPQGLELPAREIGDLLAIDLDAAARGVEQASQQPRGRGLAAAGLTDDSERLAALHLEGQAVHRANGSNLLLEDDPRGDREVLDEVADLDQRLALLRLCAHPAPC